MRAAFRMWKETRMIILTAVCSAIYGGSLIAFKTAIPLVPGYTEVRVANIFPMVFGLLFGPAGAWGTATGNLIGDLLGGTLGPGSLPGFVGNFLLGYLPYALWTTLTPLARGSWEWVPGSWRCWTNYLIVAIVSSASCAIVIGTVVDAMGTVPYAVLTKIITINDILGSLIGVALLTSIDGVTRKQLNLFWRDVMEKDDISPPRAGTIGAWLVAVASLFGLLGGIITALPGAAFGWICTFAIIAGSLLL